MTNMAEMVDLSIAILLPVRGEATSAPEGLVQRDGEPRAGPVSSTLHSVGKECSPHPKWERGGFTFRCK